MLLQNEWEQINRMAGEINRIKDVTKFRREFLSRLGRLVPFDLADFYLNDPGSSGRIRLVDPVVISRFSQKFNDKFMVEYDRYYGQVDYVKWVFSSHESIVYRESDLINAELRTKSAFFLDYLKPAGFINVAGMSIAEKGACVGAVTLYRTEQFGDFTDREVYILKQFLPHLQGKLMEEESSTAVIKKRKRESSFLVHEFGMSSREMEVLRLLCDGRNNGEISKQLSISVNTVKKHISNIFHKLSVDSRTQLIHFVIKNDREILEED